MTPISADSTTVAEASAPPSIPEDQIQTAEVFGANIFGLKNDRIFTRLVNEGVHERVETALVPQFAKFGSTVLDIGANIGYYSAWLRHAVGPKGAVHAFEANPATAGLLRRTIKENGWDNVILNEAAVSDNNEPLLIRYDEDFTAERAPDSYNLGGWSLRRRAKGNLRIPTITIDEYREANELPRVSFMKIDVEGFERRVLRGAKRTISSDKPVLMIELLGRNDAGHKLNLEIIKFLTNASYVLAKTSGKPVPRLLRVTEDDYQTQPYHFYVFCLHKRIADEILPL